MEEPIERGGIDCGLRHCHAKASVTSLQGSTLSEPDGALKVITASCPPFQNSYRSTSSSTILSVTGSGGDWAVYLMRTAGPARRVTDATSSSARQFVAVASF